MAKASDAALAYADEHRDAFLEDLKALLRIPSISTLPEHQTMCARRSVRG